MAGKLITLDEAAAKLGVTPEELNEMRSRGEIYGYRDGATWKFKAEDLDRLAAERANPSEESGVRLGESSEDMILVSEFEIGASGPSTSSTIIGKAGEALSPDDSDIRIVSKEEQKGGGDPGSDVTLADASGVEIALGPGAGASSGGSDLELPVHEDDAIVIDSGGSDLSLELSDDASVLGANEPDEFVLHASGVGSDITISPGDSGISLVDPSDSGLSLEAPLELKTSTADSEEFDLSSSDQVVAPESDASFDSDSIVDVKSDDEFLLTPLEEVGEEDSMDSGSQVIALDTDSGLLGESSGGLLSGESSDSVAMSGMLEVDESMPGMSFDSGGLGTAVAAEPGAAVITSPVSARETQFTGGVVAGLGIGVLFMALAGMMTYDLMINMWSWDGAFTVNSAIMDTIVGLFEG